VRRTNTEFGYSIVFPEDWLFEEMNYNEVTVRPTDSQYDQIQIGAYFVEPVIASVSQSVFADSIEASVQEFFDALGSTNLDVYVNSPATGKWDWVALFTVDLQDVPLQGQVFVKETDSISYLVFLVQSTGDWPEGQSVIDSFTLEG
jgi:hypothetical protein